MTRLADRVAELEASELECQERLKTVYDERSEARLRVRELEVAIEKACSDRIGGLRWLAPGQPFSRLSLLAVIDELEAALKHDDTG